MRVLRRSLLVLCLCLPVSGTALVQAASTPAFVVVVHPGNAHDGASAKFIAEAFLKKTTRWSGGETLRPVDQRVDSSVRAHFSARVLKRSPAAVRSYWQQQVFAGRDVPPPELNGDAEVLAFVRKHAGAIGYVSGAAELGGVKVLTVR